VARQRDERRHPRAPHGVRRRLHGHRGRGRVHGPGALDALAGRGGGVVRGRHGPGPRRIRAHPASAGRVLDQRRPGFDRRRLRGGRGHRPAPGRRHPGRRLGCIEFPAVAGQRAGLGQPAGDAGAAIRLRRDHPAERQDLDRVVRPVPAGPVPDRGAAAGPAPFAVGPLAIRAKAGQAGPGPPPGAAFPRAGDPVQDQDPGPRRRLPPGPTHQQHPAETRRLLNPRAP